MINTRLFPVLILLLLSPSLHAQSGTEADDKPFIEVTGTAELEFVPDEIYIDITLREKSPGKDRESIGPQEEKLKTSLKSIGIDLNNLYLADMNADYMRIGWRPKDLLTSKHFSLKVADAATAGKVFRQLDQLEITDAAVTRVDHTKIDSFRKAVRIEAIKAAKAKADYLLAAIGEQTGKPLLIQEKEPGRFIPSGLNYSSNVGTEEADNDTRKKEDGAIRFEQMKVKSSIYVKFRIR